MSFQRFVCLFHFTNLFYVIGRDAPLHVVLKNEVTLEKLSKEFSVSRDALLRVLKFQDSDLLIHLGQS